MPNRLANETSPYLLQHSNNPVDWYAWCAEALERAKEEDKPILLSIGYSACHWCHVMEHESFENEDIAKVMNDSFINIKVDREERPDLDQIYMTAVQMMTGSGGWPLTVFLLPNGQPFFGGTYFPPDDRYNRPGFRRVLETISEAYRTKRQDVSDNADVLLNHLRQTSKLRAEPTTIDKTLLDEVFRSLSQRFDSYHGGFGTAPKFPPSMSLDFLLRYHHRTGNEEALEMVILTLDKMAYGGLYDQIGGAFHRYSTDERWLTPHFEKMLYDNALLARTYLDAYRATRLPLYKRIVEETLDFVAREMRDPNGGFFSTLDADSEGAEGKFYVWSLEEFQKVVGPNADLLAKYFNITEDGNFEHNNIINVPRPPEAFFRVEGVSLPELESKITAARHQLLAAREKRVRPGRDEKILTDWNGLMLRAFAEGAMYLGREDYRQIAEANAGFLLSTLWNGDQLLHSYKDGRARFNGYLDDYANFADGLFALYQLTLDSSWLDRTLQILEPMIARFWDSDNGGFFFTSNNHENLISRNKDYFDNATPAGNSVAADLLVRLAAILNEPRYRKLSEQIYQMTANLIRQYPSGFGRMLAGFDFFIGPSKEIAVVGDIKPFLPVFRGRYLPRVVLAGGASNIALLKDRPRINGRSTVYVCENFTCSLPVTEPADLDKQLRN